MSIFFFEASDSLGDEAVVDVIGDQVDRAATETATHYGEPVTMPASLLRSGAKSPQNRRSIYYYAFNLTGYLSE